MGLLSLLPKTKGELAGFGEGLREDRLLREEREYNDKVRKENQEAQVALLKTRFGLQEQEAARLQAELIEKGVNAVYSALGSKLPASARASVYKLLDGGVYTPESFVEAWSSGKIKWNESTKNARYSLGSMEEMSAYWTQLEQEYDLPSGFLATTASIESSLGKNMSNKVSSAKGMFAFIDSTAKQYDVDVYDWKSSSLGAAKLAAANKKSLQERLNRTDISGAELYLAHQQGAGGAASLLSRPTAMAVDVVGTKAISNNVPSDKKGTTFTAQQFSDLYFDKYESNRKQVEQYVNTPLMAGPVAIANRSVDVQEPTGKYGFEVQSAGEIEDVYKYLAPYKDNKPVLQSIAADENQSIPLRNAARLMLDGMNSNEDMSWADWIEKNKIENLADARGAITWLEQSQSSKLTDTERAAALKYVREKELHFIKEAANKALGEGEKVRFYPLNEDGSISMSADIIVYDANEGAYKSTVNGTKYTKDDIANGMIALKGEEPRKTMVQFKTTIEKVSDIVGQAELSATGLLRLRNLVEQNPQASNKYIQFLSAVENEVDLIVEAFNAQTNDHQVFNAETRDGFVMQAISNIDMFKDLKGIDKEIAQLTLYGAYDLAASKGSRGQALSDKELKANLEALGVGLKAEQRLRLINSSITTLLNNFESLRNTTYESIPWVNDKHKQMVQGKPYTIEVNTYIQSRLPKNTFYDGQMLLQQLEKAKRGETTVASGQEGAKNASANASQNVTPLTEEQINQKLAEYQQSQAFVSDKKSAEKIKQLPIAEKRTWLRIKAKTIFGYYDPDSPTMMGLLATVYGLE